MPLQQTTIDPPKPSIARRVLWTALAPLTAQLIGSAFNIWYDLTHIKPLLTPDQAEAFTSTIMIYNICVYPVALTAGLAIIWTLAGTARMPNPKSDPKRWRRAQRMAINLPWWATAIAAPAWIATIPVMLITLHMAPGPLNPLVNIHLPISVTIAALMALTQMFFALEIISQRLWYPLFFADDRPAQTPGVLPLTLTRRGLMWAVSAVICPIISLLLLIAAPTPLEITGDWFPFSVGGIGIVFGLASAAMLAKIVIEPLETLRRRARRVAQGDLGPDVEIDLLRSDEFGTLIDQFNDMVSGLRDKQRVEQLLGRNIDPSVAKLLLTRGDDVRGIEREITVLFADIRDFTPRCAALPPKDVVTMLNVFFEVMIANVEKHHGIVNQFVGDGFMAIFGAIEDGTPHADNAVAAGRAMLGAMPEVNQRLAELGLEPLKIGIGINTGPAVVGSIGTPTRSTYSAIGDTVNVTARIESSTKDADRPLLFSQSTYDAMDKTDGAIKMPPQRLKGKAKPVRVYSIELDQS
jgi:adenylate cyclase